MKAFWITRLLHPFLKRFFHLLYHQLAWSYDLVSMIVSIGSWKNWVQSVGSDLEGPQILELGFGPGHLQSLLASSSKIRAFGLDASPQMARIASRRLKRMGSKQHLVLGNAISLPYLNACFDQVVATFPTEYIFIPETAQEIKRILKNIGTVIILYQAQLTGSHLLSRVAGWLFSVTGQTEELDAYRLELALKTFTDAGFAASIVTRDLDGSRLTYLIAKLPTAIPPNCALML